MFGGELKPGQEVEGLFQIAPVVQPPRDRREVFKPGGDVMGALLEDPPAFVLRRSHHAWDLRTGISAISCGSL